MRKSYLTIAVAAAMLASCAQNEMLIENNDTTQVEIGFETYAGTQTKTKGTEADNPNHTENSTASSKSNLENHHTTFKAWGAKVAGTHQAVWAAASPATVTYSTDKWVAAPAKFWDKSASQYYFYAAAPSDQSWALAWKADDDMSDATITLADFKLTGVNVTTAASTTAATTWSGKSDIDLMIASACPVERASYNKTNPDKVNLHFNHILSRLNIMVKKGTSVEDSEVSLKELKVYNLKNKGSFDESKAPESKVPKLSAGTVARWADTSSPSVDGTYTPFAIALTASSKEDGVTTTAQYVLETLIIPQNITYQEIDINGKNSVGGSTDLGTDDQAYIYIKYAIDDEEFFGYYNLAKTFKATASSTTVPFNEGWQNTLTITIQPALIEFDADVYDWANYSTAGSQDVPD